MASPQKENGYVPIANELFNALCKMRIPGEARQCLDFIFRKTYGFNKKCDAIPLSQFVEATGMKRPNVCRAINKLVEMNIVIRNDTASITVYGVNKDYEKWMPVSKVIHVSKVITNVIKSDNNRYQKRYTQKTITKDKRHIHKNMKSVDYDSGEVSDFGVKKKRHTKEENNHFIAIGRLWTDTVKKNLELDDHDIPHDGIINLIRPIYDGKGWRYADFDVYFKWFFAQKLDDEMKVSFKLALSKSMLAKYLVSKRRKEVIYSPAQVTDLRL